MERRKISKEVYDKIIKQIPNKIIEMLPDKPENLLRYATRIIPLWQDEEHEIIF